MSVSHAELTRKPPKNLIESKGFFEEDVNLLMCVLGAALVQVLMLELIREHEFLFAKVPPSVSTRLPGGLHASPSALRQPHLHESACLRQLSLPLITEHSRDPGQSTTDAQNPR